MTQEEKAKAYDEALKVLHKYDGANIMFSQSLKEEMFPELKVNEDERIRQFLIHEVTETSDEIMSYRNMSKKDVLAWLEKQGDANKEYWRGYREGKEEILDKYAELEKQGEQKPYGQRQECVDCQFNYAGECKGFCSMKRDEQKPTDKVEPKFHEGDWIVYDGWTTQIKEVYEDGYSNIHQGFIPKKREEEMRLWTIQDAKDGDVLNSMRVQATIIFKGFADDGKHILAYCALQKGIFIKQEMLWDRDFKPCPKNWNNELFSKMKEAGYMWDAEKKELKKIEQKPDELIKEYDFHGVKIVPKFKKGDLIREKHSGRILTIKDFSYDNGLYTYDTGQFPITIQNHYELAEQKPSWSEEDKEFINDLIGIFDGQQYQAHSDEEIVKWLKSIRLPYNKEWDENDEEMLKSIIATCELACEDRDSSPAKHLLEMQTNWLKSLRPQNTWKPSDEQMVALDIATMEVWTIQNKERLSALYQDLKKLRGE